MKMHRLTEPVARGSACYSMTMMLLQPVLRDGQCTVQPEISCRMNGTRKKDKVAGDIVRLVSRRKQDETEKP